MWISREDYEQYLVKIDEHTKALRMAQVEIETLTDRVRSLLSRVDYLAAEHAKDTVDVPGAHEVPLRVVVQAVATSMGITYRESHLAVPAPAKAVERTTLDANKNAW